MEAAGDLGGVVLADAAVDELDLGGGAVVPAEVVDGAGGGEVEGEEAPGEVRVGGEQGAEGGVAVSRRGGVAAGGGRGDAGRQLGFDLAPWGVLRSGREARGDAGGERGGRGRRRR